MSAAARPRVSDDDEHLIRLLQSAVDATQDARGGDLLGVPEREDPAHKRLQRFIDDPQRAALTGTYEGAVVGVTLLSVCPSTIGTLGAIDELYVERDGREVGVGEALMEAAMQWCVSQGAVAMDMDALPGDRARKNLCERSGFSARLLVMHRRL